jgi:hypothetical protein
VRKVAPQPLRGARRQGRDDHVVEGPAPQRAAHGVERVLRRGEVALDRGARDPLEQHDGALERPVRLRPVAPAARQPWHEQGEAGRVLPRPAADLLQQARRPGGAIRDDECPTRAVRCQRRSPPACAARIVSDRATRVNACDAALSVPGAAASPGASGRGS